jgi:hypothetical protein
MEPLKTDGAHPKSLVTHKEPWGGQSRTIFNYWSNLGPSDANHILMNRIDAQRLGIEAAGKSSRRQYQARPAPSQRLNDIELDGETVEGDRRRKAGMCPKSVVLTDPRLGNVCLVDTIGGRPLECLTPTSGSWLEPRDRQMWRTKALGKAHRMLTGQPQTGVNRRKQEGEPTSPRINSEQVAIDLAA